MFNLKSFFKKKEEKAIGERQGYSYRGDTFGIGESIETTTDLYYKLYRENTDLRRCVEELYQTIGKEGFVLKKGENVVNNTEVLNILNFENGFNLFRSVIIRDLQVAGNVYIIPVFNGLSKIIGWQVLDPRTIRIIANKYGEIIQYLQVRGGNSQIFKPNQIYHFKDSIDHDNEVFGISKVETLVYDILSDKESGRSNYSFFKNNAIPSTLITLDNELDEEEIKIALQQLKKQFSGGDNKHRVSASTGIKDVKVLGNSIKDMEFISLRHFTTERICSAMGVPKTILGYSDNVNYSTSDNQYRKFIENTINPLEKTIEHIINILIKDTGINFEFIKNQDFGIEEKITRYEKLLNMGVMTINEIRADLGLELHDNENANIPIIKSGYVLIDDIGVDVIAGMGKIPDNEL